MSVETREQRGEREKFSISEVDYCLVQMGGRKLWSCVPRKRYYFQSCVKCKIDIVSLNKSPLFHPSHLLSVNDFVFVVRAPVQL